MTNDKTTTSTTSIATPNASINKLEVIANSFIGLSKYGAQAKSEAMSFIFRLIEVDGESFLSLPEDKREDRICVYIKNGKIVSAVVR